MQLRQITPHDNAALAAMIRTVFDEHGAPHAGTVYSDPTTDDLYGLFRKQDSVLWVAQDDAGNLGCCGIYPTAGLPKGYVELVKFYIPAIMRGKGIGKMLMEAALQSAEAMGYTHIYIESHPAFAKAVQIYEKYGFSHLPAPLGNSGHGGCNIWMLKALSAEA